MTPDRKVLTYCRTGEQSSRKRLVLKYPRGYSDVRNADGSWTEWGHPVRTPIEKA